MINKPDSQHLLDISGDFNGCWCYIKPPEVWTVCLTACRVFQSLWIERTTLILTHPLPGISRWFEVEKRELVSTWKRSVKINRIHKLTTICYDIFYEVIWASLTLAPRRSASLSQVEVSPLENAISVVENKNQELRTLISQYQHKQLHGNINLLSMTLNGVIDAAVNGGIARYQEVRQTGNFMSSAPVRLSHSSKILQRITVGSFIGRWRRGHNMIKPLLFYPHIKHKRSRMH